MILKHSFHHFPITSTVQIAAFGPATKLGMGNVSIPFAVQVENFLLDLNGPSVTRSIVLRHERSLNYKVILKYCN